MQKTRGTTLTHFLVDHFSPEWKLLSETEGYVSHTPDFAEHEQQFKEWRLRLQNKAADDADRNVVRSEIVALRKTLRLKGYDFSLGLQRLFIEGFRNDDSIAKGFRRVVICFCDPNVYYQTGSENHVTIAEELLDTLERKKLLTHPEVHYLWYLRNQKGLILSGSATETAAGFERIEARSQANPMKLLATLRDLS